VAEYKKVSFTRMADGTAADYQIVMDNTRRDRPHIVGHVLELLEKLKTVNPSYQISRYQHSLQSATLAEAAGESEEYVVGALLHDIGDSVAPENHSALAAAVLQPYVSERVHWIVLHHGLFQGYYYLHHFGKDRNLRDTFKGHEYYQACVDFCARYDQCAFDPKMPYQPLEHFLPAVKRIFTREPFSATKTAREGRSITSLGYAVAQAQQ
jgi:predicted HD phosphohydrolase